MESTDEELMIAYQMGDSEAFGALYKRHAPKVYGFIKSRVHTGELADDILQNTFLKLHRSRAKYDNKFSFSAWIFTIARSTLIDAMRSEMKSKISSHEAEISNATTAEDQKPVDLPDLSSLPTNQRSALEMRYLEELQFAEIAKRLDTTSTNVRQLISRAIKKLRGAS